MYARASIFQIVGSEIFNQLIICAGAVYACKSKLKVSRHIVFVECALILSIHETAKTGSLKLDRAIVMREVGFYALAITTLYVALQDSRPDESDDSGIEHIYISFNEACLVFGGYVLYVIVCANMEAVVACFTKVKAKSDSLRDAVLKDSKGYGAISTSKVRTALLVAPTLILLRLGISRIGCL